MSVAVAERLYTEEEYLVLERAADHKSEFFNGRIYAMAGASGQHIRITTNTSSELHQLFKGRPCEIFSTELKIKVSETGLYTYPDIVAVCGEQRYTDDRQDTLLNPTVLIEVLSPSTEAYDRGDKFAHYRNIESLQEVLLVSQHRILIDHYTRQGDEWLLKSYSDVDSIVTLESVGARLPVREIYDRVEFPAIELMRDVSDLGQP